MDLLNLDFEGWVRMVVHEVSNYEGWAEAESKSRIEVEGGDTVSSRHEADKVACHALGAEESDSR